MALGVGTIAASAIGHRLARRIGPGPTLVLGFGISGAGWLLLALAPLNVYGIAAFALMLLMYGVGAVFIFINFLALRQSVTPGPHARPHDQHHALADPAAGRARAHCVGGWLGQHYGLRATLGFAGSAALLLCAHGLAAAGHSQRQDVADVQGGSGCAFFVGGRALSGQCPAARAVVRADWSTIPMTKHQWRRQSGRHKLPPRGPLLSNEL